MLLNHYSYNEEYISMQDKKKKSDISVNEFSSNEMLGSRTLYFLFFTTQEPHTFFFFLET